MPQSMARVSEVMTKDVIHTISENSSVEEAAKRMRELRRGCLVVVEKGQLVGIITERDFVHRVVAEGKSPKNTLVSEIMSKPVITVGPEALVSDAAKIMADNWIRRLPITEGNQVIGMVTVTDFARYLETRPGFDEMLVAMARAPVLFAQS
jgi:CBS domain-containing protein